MKPRILVLDDEESILQLISDYFTAKGCVVTMARTGGETIDLVHGGEFELAILDINLAGENGLELLSYLRSRHPELPIVMYTGLDDRDDDLLERARLRGASGFMSKGAPLDSLFAAVKTYLGRLNA